MDNLKIFCEFPWIDDRQDCLTWHRDPRMARYLSGLEDRSPAQIADLLVTRIHATPTDRLACGCVTALLAHILFSASGRVRIRSQIFQPLQYHSIQIELADVYQIALGIISEPIQFLANFQPNSANWYGSLVRYSNYRFDRLLIDRLRSLPGMSGFKRTNLGLLARATPKRIETALIRQGEKDVRLQQMLLLHGCLVEVIAAGNFETRNPQSVHYENLLARYLQQCERVELAILQRRGSANEDRATLIKLLEYMGKVIRNYLQPQPDALDRSVGNSDADGTSLLNLIPDAINLDRLLESRILKQDILDLSSQLPIDHDRLLMLFYGLELTQSEVGIELDCSQTTAKHRHDRCLKQLAKDLHVKIFDDENLSIELLDAIIDRLKLICEDIYAEILLAIFDAIVTDLDAITSGTAKLNESTIVELFIDRIHHCWQFKFKPAQMGLTKATAFVRLRNRQDRSPLS
jgi:RNA polymerase sigma factor (sigma-70 family)